MVCGINTTVKCQQRQAGRANEQSIPLHFYGYYSFCSCSLRLPNTLSEGERRETGQNQFFPLSKKSTKNWSFRYVGVAAAVCDQIYNS